MASLEATKLLYIHSPLLPGTVGDNMLSFDAQASLAATGTTVGPFLEPVQQCNLQVEVEGCVVQPPDVIGDACEGRVTSMVLEYTGGGCEASSHLQNRRKTACWGGANGESPVLNSKLGPPYCRQPHTASSATVPRRSMTANVSGYAHCV